MKTKDGIKEKKPMFRLNCGGKASCQCNEILKAIMTKVGQMHGCEMRLLVWTGTETNYKVPEHPGKDSGEDKIMIWKIEWDQFLKKQDRYEDEKAKVFTMILSRCNTLLFF